MLSFPRDTQQVLTEALGATVKVLGVGGAGCNVVDRMAMDGVDGAELLTLNTDSRALANAVTPHRVQLGATLTRGLGAGGDPDIGREAALESAAEIRAAVEHRKLVFLCAGLGGGTGSGAAPEIARIAREAGAMVISFATLPFTFEGRRRVAQATDALERLREHSDAVIIFENDRMGEVALATDGVQKAFEAADRLVGRSIRSVAAIVTRPGLIRIGLDDLLSVLRPSSGFCLFGHGQGDGENRAKEALDKALRSPLLNRGRLLNHASAVLVHVTGGDDLRLFEVQTLMREIGRHVDDKAQLHFGMAVDPALKKSLSVTIFSPLASDDGRSDDLAAPPAETSAPEPVAPAEPEPALFADTDFELPEIPGIESYQEPSDPAEYLADDPPEPAAPIDSPPPLPSNWADAVTPQETESPYPIVDDAAETIWTPEPAAPPAAFSEPTPAAEPPAPHPLLNTAAQTRSATLPETDDESSLPGKTTRIRLGQPQPMRAPSRELDDLLAPGDSDGQRELQLGARSGSGRFDKAEPTVIDGEDIDLPAYLRKKRRPQ